MDKVIYKIKLGREIINQTGHLLFGAAISFGLNDLLFMTYVNFFFGSLRELLQDRRNKIQPFYIQMLDIWTFPMGGLFWWGIKSYFNLNVDLW